MGLLREIRFLFQKQPFHIIFYPTSRCNALCPHCYNSARQEVTDQSRELSIEEIRKISCNLGHIKVLTVSGGEPFLREDLFEIVSVFYHQNSLQYVSIHTNAFLTDRVVKTVETIVRAYRDLTVIICISIDGIGEVHDRIRGVKNGFQKAVETIRRLNEIRKTEKNLFLVSTTMFSKSTQGSFHETIDFVRDKLGVKPSLSFIRGKVSSAEEKDINVEEYRNYTERLQQLHDSSIKAFSPMAVKEAIETMVPGIVMRNYYENRQSVPCQAGRRSVVIYENGDVYPCETSGQSFGNLRDAGYSVKRLLASDAGRVIQNQIYREKSCCCTWENIIPINLLFDFRSWPKIIYRWFRLFVRHEGAAKE